MFDALIYGAAAIVAVLMILAAWVNSRRFK